MAFIVIPPRRTLITVAGELGDVDSYVRQSARGELILLYAVSLLLV